MHKTKSDHLVVTCNMCNQRSRCFVSLFLWRSSKRPRSRNLQQRNAKQWQSHQHRVHGTEKIINRKLVLEVSYIIITSAETPTDDVDQQLENTNRNMKTSRTTKDGNWKRGNLAETQPMMNRPPSKHQNDISSREPANYSAISTSLF